MSVVSVPEAIGFGALALVAVAGFVLGGALGYGITVVCVVCIILGALEAIDLWREGKDSGPGA